MKVRVSDLVGQGGSPNMGKGRPVQGQGAIGEWKIRKLKSFEKCFACKTLLRKGERVYCRVNWYGGAGHCCLSHGDPTDWLFDG